MRAASPLAFLPGALPLLLSLAAIAAEPDCRYRVTVEGAEAGALRVALRCAADGIGGFTIDPAARPFVKDVRIDGRTAVLTDGQWPVPASDRDATEVSYRLDLDGFAATADDADAARRSGGAVVAGLSALLARPLAPRRLAIAFEPGAAAVATALPVTDGGFRIDSAALPKAGAIVLGRFERRTLRLRAAAGGMATLELAMLLPVPGARGLPFGSDVAEVSTTTAMLAACDAPVGGSVTRDLATQHLGGGAAFDLPALWRSLGVALTGEGRVVTDDRAPLAAVRRAIVAGRAPPPPITPPAMPPPGQ